MCAGMTLDREVISMKPTMAFLWVGTLVIGYIAGYAASPAGSAAAGQTGAQAPPAAGALPPGDYSRIQLAPDQGEPFAWSIDDMRKAHSELVARAARNVPT